MTAINTGAQSVCFLAVAQLILLHLQGFNLLYELTKYGAVKLVFDGVILVGDYLFGVLGYLTQQETHPLLTGLHV